jgi:L-threonylcarbamoyladenylate synthase
MNKIAPLAKILEINRDHPEPALIAEAAAIIKDGGIVAYLTDTLYGLGADAFNAAAVQRVFDIKSRSQEKALPVIIGERDFLPVIAPEISTEARRLIERFWPGPLSLILRAAPSLPGVLHGHTGVIAARLPACAVARELAAASGGVLTATSANRSGAAAAQTAAEVLTSLGNAIDLVIDSGPATVNRPSTMLDVTISPPRLRREGVISFAHIDAIVKVQR